MQLFGPIGHRRYSQQSPSTSEERLKLHTAILPDPIGRGGLLVLLPDRDDNVGWPSVAVNAMLWSCPDRRGGCLSVTPRSCGGYPRVARSSPRPSRR